MKSANVVNILIFMVFPIYPLSTAEVERSAEYDDTGNLCDNCVEARDCPIIANALNARPRSADFFRLLKRIKCGSNSNRALVCCDLITDKVLEVFFGKRGLSYNQNRRSYGRRGHQFPQTNRPFSLPLGHPILEYEFKDFVNQDPKPNKLNEDECGMSLVNRIVGGHDALLGQFPWMAQLGYRDESGETRYRCGGALVTARHVLTAAHCVVKLPPIYATVSFINGCVTVRLGEPQKDFAPLQRVAHEDYDRPRLQNDIALLKINDTVSFTQYLRPICVPFAGRAVDLSKVQQNSLVVAGWGFTTPGLTTHSETLRWTKMSYLEQEKCESIYKENFKLDVGRSQLCTKPVLNVDACGGDSGGPLFWEGEGGAAVLVGLVSFGPRRCGTPSIPGVYTDVAAHARWIERTLHSLEAT